METEFKKQVKHWAEKFFSGNLLNAILTDLEEYDEKNEKKLILLEDYVSYFKNSENRFEELVYCLYKCEETYKRYQEKSIPDKIFNDTFQDLRLWSEFYYRESGKVGISEIDWFAYLFNMRIFNIYGLEFEIGMLDEGNSFGLPAGKVLKIHIPAGTSLSQENCKNSLIKGNEFVRTYFPQYAECQIVCESWLLWKKLKDFLNADSHILSFQNMFNIVCEKEKNSLVKFVFGKINPETNLEDFEAQTSLQKKLLEFKKSGGKFKIGYGILNYEKRRNAEI